MSQFRSRSDTGNRWGQEGPSLLKLEPNTNGKDYFVGDLHGEGRLLLAVLKALKFDWTVDRLIAVGDLVDRGSSHAELFQTIIGQPGFYSVLGNHDVHCWSQLQSYFNDGVWPKDPELEWLREFGLDDGWAIRNFFRSLPLAIHVTLGNGLRVGVVHADVPDGMVSFSDLANISRDYLPMLTAKSPISSLLLGRTRATTAGNILWDCAHNGPPSDLSNAQRLNDVGNDLDLIICGHSLCWTLKPFHVGNWLFLDSGAGYPIDAVKDAALSVVDLVSRRVAQAFHEPSGGVSTREFTLADPFVISNVALPRTSNTP